MDWFDELLKIKDEIEQEEGGPASLNYLSYLEYLLKESYINENRKDEIQDMINNGLTLYEAKELSAEIFKDVPNELSRLQSGKSLNVGEMDKAISIRLDIENLKKHG